MVKKYYLLLVLLYSLQLFSQIENITEKFILPSTIEENSGLLFYNDKLITHNDSGNLANLYELDTITNQITRTIQISNAINVDWEDIAQDNDYIYIGDIGNNLGSRTDLKIYKIQKSDYLTNNTVTASVINFSYEDQTDFTNNSDTNFDAEAMVVIGNNIHIFTKNHTNLETNQYIIPKTLGTHTATLINSYNVAGLITGATLNTSNNSVFLCGYNQSLQPFLVLLSDFNDTIFNVFTKYDLQPTIANNQIEGITLINNNHYFISSEKFTYSSYIINQKLFTFDYSPNVNGVNDTVKFNFSLYPNPAKNELFRVSSYIT